ncbi:MAG: hypothetical protein B7Z54_06435, partial [Sphingobacteriales bacterium 12-47-4]
YFGINSAEDLPKIREVLAEQLVEPTLIRHADAQEMEAIMEKPLEEVSPAMVVNETGELLSSPEESSNEPGGEETES